MLITFHSTYNNGHTAERRRCMRAFPATTASPETISERATAASGHQPTTALYRQWTVRVTERPRWQRGSPRYPGQLRPGEAKSRSFTSDPCAASGQTAIGCADGPTQLTPEARLFGFRRYVSLRFAAPGAHAASEEAATVCPASSASVAATPASSRFSLVLTNSRPQYEISLDLLFLVRYSRTVETCRKVPLGPGADAKPEKLCDD